MVIRRSKITIFLITKLRSSPVLPPYLKKGVSFHFKKKAEKKPKKRIKSRPEKARKVILFCSVFLHKSAKFEQDKSQKKSVFFLKSIFKKLIKSQLKKKNIKKSKISYHGFLQCVQCILKNNKIHLFPCITFMPKTGMGLP